MVCRAVLYYNLYTRSLYVGDTLIKRLLVVFAILSMGGMASLLSCAEDVKADLVPATAQDIQGEATTRAAADSAFAIHTGASYDGHSIYARTCTSQSAITDYTFDGTEQRNGGYQVNTATGNKTVNIDADLFSTGYEVTICKGTADSNTVTLDSQAGNNINGTQTYVLDSLNELVTLVKDGANTWKIKSGYSSTWGTDAISAALGNHTSNTTNAHGIDSKANLAGGNTFTSTNKFDNISTQDIYGRYMAASHLASKGRFDTTTTLSSGVEWNVDFNDSGTNYYDSFITFQGQSSVNRTLNQIVARRAGLYKVDMFGLYDADTNGQRFMTVKKNGSALFPFVSDAVGGGERTSFSYGLDTFLDVGDRLTLTMKQTSGGPVVARVPHLRILYLGDPNQ